MNGTRPPRLPREPVDMSWQWSLAIVLLICVALTGGAVYLAVRVIVGILEVVGRVLG